VSIAGSIRTAGLAVILSWGWKRALIALLAGAASSLAMEPFNAWPVLFITFPLAVWLIDGAGAGRLGGVPAAALTGWLFGFGYFVPGLYWIGNAFLVDAQTFAWLMPFAVIGLPAYLALFTALGFALARLIWTKDASRILALAAALTIAEWLRGHVLTGFPWNAFGYALTEPLALAQMQASRIHLALVVDEYGGTDGLVSIEDLVEQIVGDISDEHDLDEELIVRNSDGSFTLSTNSVG
jgi:apolipoprotein N-acyltransferase